ncbi:MAG: right-handed parallel beta-helix repeat-containing protein, partial [Bacteroidetes bacterium]|nr:right-handed parallel beta-helix repeat-containing protein [Bacteroidota bacterium]
MKAIIYLITVILAFSVGNLGASNYIVTSSQDTGQSTLRWAIGQANSSIGLDTIQFNIPSSSGVIIISPISELPAITDPLFIDGYSQAGNVDTNINLILSGNSLDYNQSYGFVVNTGIFKVQGLHFNDFNNNLPYWGGGRIAIFIQPKNSHTSKIERIDIEYNSFSKCIQAIKLHKDYQFTSDTFDCVNISHNLFHRVKHAFESDIPGIYLNVKSLNNWKLNNNTIKHCMGLAFDIDFRDIAPSVDSFSIEFNDNIILGLDSANCYSYGIELLLPNSKSRQNELSNVSIKNNYMRGLCEAIYIVCPEYIDSNSNNIIKIDIHNNDITGKNSLYGVRIGGGNGLSYSIKHNTIDSCSNGLKIEDGFAADIDIFTNTCIDSNNFSHNGHGVYLNTAGINNNLQVSNNILINNSIGLRLDFGDGDVDSVVITNNIISNNGSSGVEVSAIGTGSCIINMSNCFITNNSVFNNSDDGISLELGGASSYKCTITNFRIEENKIYQNGLSGINVFSSSHSSNVSLLNHLIISENQIDNNFQNGISFLSLGVCGAPSKFKNIEILNNSISYNNSDGIKIESVDDASGLILYFYESLNISQNKIHGNKFGKGILHYHSPSLFKPGIPVINSASTINNSINTSYSLTDYPNSTYIVEMFLSDSVLYSPEQGKTWIGSDTITTNNQGIASKTSQFNVSCPYNSFLSMTAREIQKGMTSEFSPYCLVTSLPSNEKGKFSIFPNPATDIVYVKSDIIIYCIAVYNNLGELVMVRPYNQMQVALNINDMQTGLYVITI